MSNNKNADSLGPRAHRALPIAAAVVILTLGFLPIVNWIPGGHTAPWFGSRIDEWTTGSLIVIGAGVVLSIIGRRIRFPGGETLATATRWAGASPGCTGWIIAGLAFGVYASVALGVFSGVPLHLDELAQVIQARIFAQGRLFLDAPAYPEFTSLLHVLDTGGRWYTQFPPGGPALLLPAVWAGAAWLAGPVSGALSVRLFWAIVRRTEVSMSVALGAALLFAFAPFVMFMSGSHMNHVGTLFMALLATFGCIRASLEPARAARFAFLSGLALGVMGTIRPVDAVAFALPIGGWFLARALRSRQRADLVALLLAGAGVMVPLTLLALYNLRTTGSPFAFAYEVQWGQEHGLGFHRAPWGFAHTPLRGLELISLYFLRLQTYLFESPLPSLVFPALTLFLTRKLNLLDRLWLYSGTLLVTLYFFYWHDGFYLGPRFLYLLAPPLALWTARLPGLLASALVGRPSTASMANNTLVATLLFALVVNIPLRAQQYRAGLVPMRSDAALLARDAGITNGLIFVRESWGAQLLARMWAVGVSRSEAEALYRGVDSCALDDELTVIERQVLTVGRSFGRLRGLLVDSASLVPSTMSPDVTERMLPGRLYSRRCIRRINEDRSGFTLLAPLLAKNWAGNVFARDLHERDSLLIRDHPSRAVYLLRSAGPEFGAPLELIPLSRDSLLATWRSSSDK